MRTLSISLLILLAVGAVVSADADSPALPKVPAGFDEGRKELSREVSEGLVQPGALVERLFEQADLAELGRFIHLHMLSDERQALDDRLKLDGVLDKQREAAGIEKLFRDKKLKPAEVAGAIGKLLEARKYTLTDVVAWLYTRGYNFRILQRALNGERLDSFRLRRQLRAMDDRSASKVFVPGMWEFNLDDAREEKGGHYDGVQLAQFLLKLGWTPDDFDAVVFAEDHKHLSDIDRKLIEWGDPALVWTVMEPFTPESSLAKAVVTHYKDRDDPAVMQACLDRADTTLRWFRTGGPGVRGVYRGPWPDAKGEPRPPTANAVEIGNVDSIRFANALDEEIQAHFRDMKDTLTLVVYDDGSARAVIDKPGREPITYPVDHPFGACKSTRQPYEGRVSIEGRNALLYLVYGKAGKSAPEQFELANVKLAANGCFLVADIDDGLNLMPILLRRINPLVD
ncbi:MAG: hypothetical protein KDB82_08415 [Planctomycetes bacterium]|nr:hypothetical protein [Planctomycetota bacterium]